MPFYGTFDGDISHFDPNRPTAGDDRLPVEFYTGALKDDAASEREQRPIYRDVEFIRIFNSKDNIIDRPVRDTDKQRWPRAYAVFKATGETDPGAVGTRLEHWPLMTRAQVEEFKFFKIYTMEQLAAAPDTLGTKLIGLQRLKALAKIMIEAAQGEAPIARMQADLEKRDGEISELRSEVSRLTKLIEAATKARA